MSRSISLCALTVGALGTALCLAAVESPAAPRRQNVHGYIDSEVLTGAACRSPIGLCTVGRFSGDIRGKFIFTATTLTPSTDTGTTGVVHYTGEIVIESPSLRLAFRRAPNESGDIFIKDAGALNGVTGGKGELGAVSTITGGTKGYARLSGRISITGTFTPQTGGNSEYSGFIELP